MALIPESIARRTSRLGIAIYKYGAARWDQSVNAALDLIDSVIGATQDRLTALESEVAQARAGRASLAQRQADQDTEAASLRGEITRARHGHPDLRSKIAGVDSQLAQTASAVSALAAGSEQLGEALAWRAKIEARDLQQEVARTHDKLIRGEFG